MDIVSQWVETELLGRVAIIFIHNPPANALSCKVLGGLEVAFRRALDDRRVRVVVLTGRGQLFAAGANVRELHDLTTRSAARAFSRRGQALCALIEGAAKPIIAALNGRFVLGGATELALACHLRITEESTQLGSPEVQLGVMVGWGGSVRLPRIVGMGRAMDILLTGRRVSAQEALQMGLVNRVVADGQALEESVRLAEELARLSAPALSGTLTAVRGTYANDQAGALVAESAQFSYLCEGSDWREGTQAFVEKRRPRFAD